MKLIESTSQIGYLFLVRGKGKNKEKRNKKEIMPTTEAYVILVSKTEINGASWGKNSERYAEIIIKIHDKENPRKYWWTLLSLF